MREFIQCPLCGRYQSHQAARVEEPLVMYLIEIDSRGSHLICYDCWAWEWLPVEDWILLPDHLRKPRFCYLDNEAELPF